MLLGAFAALSFVIGIAVCAITGAFMGISWMCMLPVTAIGCLLALILVTFVF